MKIYPNMPIKDKISFDSLSVHPSKIELLQADYDGDKVTCNIVTSQEAVKEITDKLNNKTYYLDPNGGLKSGMNDKITKLVHHNMIRRREYDHLQTL